MKSYIKCTLSAVALLATFTASATEFKKFPRSEAEDVNKIMSAEYWKIWNPEVQKKMDEGIEKYRKADFSAALGIDAEGAEVKVEQISHDFIFGAHIFNFNQLGKKEFNDKYKALYGSLFNSATIPFYWKPFEPTPNNLRFEETENDTEEFWNKEYEKNSGNGIANADKLVKRPVLPHWRRPALDPVVKYLKENGVRIHGHPLVWGNRKTFPKWYTDFLDEKTLKVLNSKMVIGKYADEDTIAEDVKKLPQDKYDELFGNVGKKLEELIENRIRKIAERYGDIVDSWDVVNESATDFGAGRMVEGSKACNSHYGVMNPEYDLTAFKFAQKYLPNKALLNINDYAIDKRYVDQISNRLKIGCKIDIIGHQYHLFNPKTSREIAIGKNLSVPEKLNKLVDTISVFKKPIHMSEITITAPDNTPKGWDIQAIITDNHYRLWFSKEHVMGITWWNVVDNCGAAGEPSMSGIFTREMQPKTAFHALNNLINNEWKTKLTLEAGKCGKIAFRGFKGKYKLTWKDKNGKDRIKIVHVK